MSSLKMVSRSGKAASCSATQVDLLTTNTSSRSGRTITNDSRAISRARKTTEVAAKFVDPAGVMELPAAGRPFRPSPLPAPRRAGTRATTPRTARPSSSASPHQRAGHQSPSTSTNASTAAIPRRPGTTKTPRPDRDGVGPPFTNRLPAAPSVSGESHRATNHSTPPTSQTVNAPSLGIPVQRARWNTMVHAARAATEPSTSESDQRTARSWTLGRVRTPTAQPLSRATVAATASRWWRSGGCPSRRNAALSNAE